MEDYIRLKKIIGKRGDMVEEAVCTAAKGDI